MSDENEDGNEITEEPIEEKFESTAEELTNLKGPPSIDRKKILMAVSFALVLAVILGVVFSSGNSKKKQTETVSGFAANVPRDFLQRELERSLRAPLPSDEELPLFEEEPIEELLRVPLDEPIPREVPPPYPSPPPPPPQNNQAVRQSQPQLSSLVPKMEGSLFSSSSGQAAPPQGGASPYPPGYPEMPDLSSLMGGGNNLASLMGSGDLSSLMGQAAAYPSLAQENSYASQNNQSNKQAFYSSASGGAVTGVFLQDDLLWIGTIIPAVLVTAINTDLPGNIIARVTQNIYDSRTGRKLLIPQGSLLFAQYNSSVSYAQHRVQIVWDILIRPDGYQVELEGMNGVDSRGMAGLKAVYRENWFQYVKAAGIISLFSIANAKLVEQVAKYGSDEMASGVVTSNAEFVKEIGGNLISRAIDIQPTLTVESGEKINVQLNKNVYLPPVKDFPVKQKYVIP